MKERISVGVSILDVCRMRDINGKGIKVGEWNWIQFAVGEGDIEVLLSWPARISLIRHQAVDR